MDYLMIENTKKSVENKNDMINEVDCHTNFLWQKS